MEAIRAAQELTADLVNKATVFSGERLYQRAGVTIRLATGLHDHHQQRMQALDQRTGKLRSLMARDSSQGQREPAECFLQRREVSQPTTRRENALGRAARMLPREVHQKLLRCRQQCSTRSDARM